MKIINDQQPRPLGSFLHRQVFLELREIAKLGVPLALSSASGNLNMLVSSVLLGRLDTIALAAVSVAGIWTSVTDVLFFAGRRGWNLSFWQIFFVGNLGTGHCWELNAFFKISLFDLCVERC
jgi:hypothetical protein